METPRRAVRSTSTKLAPAASQPTEATLARLGRADLLHAVRGVEGKLLPGLVVGRHSLDDDRRSRHIDPRWQATVIAAVGDPVVARFSEAEQAGTHHPGPLGVGARSSAKTLSR
jgi:hypothetical protein